MSESDAHIKCQNLTHSNVKIMSESDAHKCKIMSESDAHKCKKYHTMINNSQHLIQSIN